MGSGIEPGTHNHIRETVPIDVPCSHIYPAGEGGGKGEEAHDRLICRPGEDLDVRCGTTGHPDNDVGHTIAIDIAGRNRDSALVSRAKGLEDFDGTIRGNDLNLGQASYSQSGNRGQSWGVINGNRSPFDQGVSIGVGNTGGVQGNLQRPLSTGKDIECPTDATVQSLQISDRTGPGWGDGKAGWRDAYHRFGEGKEERCGPLGWVVAFQRLEGGNYGSNAVNIKS